MHPSSHCIQNLFLLRLSTCWQDTHLDGFLTKILSLLWIYLTRRHNPLLEGTSSFHFSLYELWTQLSAFGLLKQHKSSPFVTVDLGGPHAMLWENPENGWRWGERLWERRWGGGSGRGTTAHWQLFWIGLFSFYFFIAWRWVIIWAGLLSLSMSSIVLESDDLWHLIFTHFTSTFCYMSFWPFGFFSCGLPVFILSPNF